MLAAPVHTPPAIVAPAVLSIPALGISRVRVGVGTGEAQLARGPGFYLGSGRPGCGCTVAIAGHRVTPVPGFNGHGPFRYIDKLRRGARIVLTLAGKTYRYVVTGQEVVSPTDTSVLAEVGHERLVLTTCTPAFTATSRLVTYAVPAP